MDSSVLLRIVLREATQLPLPANAYCIASELIVVETLRTLDRLRFRFQSAPEDLALYRFTAIELIQSINKIAVSPAILERAAAPFPTSLGSLDAIHLSTALLWQSSRAEPLVMATHDKELAIAARAMGLTTLGE